MTRIPPRLAARLLRACLPERAYESVIGDMDEEFARGRSTTWYWLCVVRSIVACSGDLCRTLVETFTMAVRQLRRQPWYVLAVAGTLALAVATATAALTVVRRGFIDPLPYPHADRLVSVLTMIPAASPVSVHVYSELTDSAGPFDAVAGVRPATATITTVDGASQATASVVTTEYFPLLGVTPVRGQLWSTPQDRAVLVSWR